MSATPNAQCLTAYYTLKDFFPADSKPTREEVQAMFQAVATEHGGGQVSSIGFANEKGKVTLFICQFGDDGNPLSIICSQPENGTPVFYTSVLPEEIPPHLMKSALDATRIKGYAERNFGTVLAASMVVVDMPELRGLNDSSTKH